MATEPDNKSPKSRRYAMTAAPFVIGAVAAYNWVIAPHVGYLQAMQRLTPVMDRMAEELDVVCGTLDEKLSTFRVLRNELATVREGLLTHGEAKAFLHELQTLVEATGCAMTEADFTRDKNAAAAEDPNAPMALETSHADLTVVGQYEQIVALLQSLQARRQRVWVDSFAMDLLDPRSRRLECQLGLTVYALLQPGELPQ